MLEIANLRAGYGAINVLWDVSLEVASGKLTTIIGPNGAGKTTLLRTIMGMLPVAQGDVRLDGNSIANIATWTLVERGLVMIPEGRMVFRDMTVEENLVMGAHPRSARANLPRNLERSYALFPKLRDRRTQLAGSLSGGEAQMVAMARGLMSDPKVLLIDEPSLGLAPVIVRELFETLAALKAEGRTIVLVEQNTRMAVEAADHVYLMQSGKVLLSRDASKVDIDELHDLYFAR
jgi:branched-chain amino acid transport system ATP-binding protein